MTDFDMILPDPEFDLIEKRKKYYELNKDKIKESQKKYREKNREKYNEYMKNLTIKLYEDEEYKKNRMEQKRIIANKHRIIQNNINPPIRGRGRPSKNINIASC
jgi:hypothetical protein